MSLQAKFLVLIGLLGLTVLFSTGAALWSARMVQRELVDPLASTARVLDNLSQVRTNLMEMREALNTEPPNALRVERVRALAADANLALDRLGVERWHPLQPRALRPRLDLAASQAETWFEQRDPEARAEAAAELGQMLEWIERRERRVLDDAALTATYGGRKWRQLLLVLGASLLAAVLLSVLALSLLRRWVSTPVASLREATARIGAGDLDHRIPVHGNDELAQLSKEVNQMASMVRSMQEERVERERLAAAGQLVRRLAHNLRNPLAGIRGLAEVTRAELSTDSELHEIQERIITSVDRFERWLSDLLDATSPLSVTPSSCRLEPWLSGIVDANRAQAQLKRVDLRCTVNGAPEEVMIDPRHLEHAIIALISNAIEASPVGGTVRIEAGVDDEASWRVSVADQGAGVPDQIREMIFKPYFTTKPDGNGIGLAVAQQVALAHGGELDLDGASANGSIAGATFVIRLPRRPAGATDPLSVHE